MEAVVEKESLKEYLDQVMKKFEEESRRLKREQKAHGIVKRVNGGLSLRIGYGWSPLKK